MNHSDKRMKAFTVLLRTAQHVEEVARKDIAQYDLNLTEFAVLELLHHKGEQPIQVIGKKVLIASSSITYVVDKLEKKGYVKRRACPEDRRVTFAHITKEGTAYMERIFPQHTKQITTIFDELTEQELEQTIELLKKIGYRAEQL
ncbi:MAG: MarR family transcriptional regulator [Solibacillus sp.]